VRREIKGVLRTQLQAVLDRPEFVEVALQQRHRPARVAAELGERRI
jgi:hypothetical protein